MGFDVTRLAALPTLADIEPRTAQLIVAARWWVCCRKRGNDPIAMLTARLRSEQAAWRLSLLMEETGFAWPEAFLLSPPCCGRLTGDEATFGAMLEAGGRGDQNAFLRLLSDMLPVEIADRLYQSARRLVSALPESVGSG